MDVLESEPNPLSVWREYRIPIILGGISFSLIVISVIILVKSFDSDSPVEFSHADVLGNVSNNSSTSADIASIYIDIEGAVMNPGIKAMPAGSRVEDVITAAGGLARSADFEYIAQKINRAMKAVDGMKLYIPFQEETSHIQNCTTSINGDVAQSCSNTVKTGKMSQNDGIVSVNMASPEELDMLPGIGPATALKIIENRPYETLEDLVSKKAVGPSVFSKIQSRISL